MSSKSKKIFIILTMISGGLFFVISFLVSMDIFRNIDYDSMVYLQSIINRELDFHLSLFTPLGSSQVMLLILIIIFLYIFRKKKYLFFGIFTYFLIYLIEIFGKFFIYHPDPPQILNRYALGIKIPSLNILSTNYAYPSGHMARIIFVSYMIGFLIFSQKNRWYKKTVLFIMLFLMVIFTFISRIYLGEHWISDVIGGLLLGIFTANLALVFYYNKNETR